MKRKHVLYLKLTIPCTQITSLIWQVNSVSIQAGSQVDAGSVVQAGDLGQLF